MKHTNFVNCNGLDTEYYEMSARDIALHAGTDDQISADKGLLYGLDGKEYAYNCPWIFGI